LFGEADALVAVAFKISWLMGSYGERKENECESSNRLVQTGAAEFFFYP
jgi:hypothetical protein